MSVSAMKKLTVLAYAADADAEYEKTNVIDLSQITPTVSCPHLPENTKTIDEMEESFRKIMEE